MISRIRASLAITVLLVTAAGAQGPASNESAAAQGSLPTVVVLATGGTIAGAAASDVQAAYTSGQVGVEQLLEQQAFPRHEGRHPARIDRKTTISRQRLEQAHIVEAQIPGEVLAAGQLDALFAERLLKRLEVQRLAVGDDAVEVEDDGLKRSHDAGTFSPARISTFSRFATGGSGHTYDLL